MFRKLLLVLAIVEALFPRQLVAAGERFAFENPGEPTLRPGVISIARIEGVLFALLAIRGEITSPPVRGLLGAIGVPALVAPGRLVRTGLWMAYEDYTECRIRPWVITVTRVMGVVYLLFALFGGRVGDDR